MSSTRQKSVLITGCSDGGLGAELAVAFHKAGCKVYATARSTARMTHLSDLGITTLELDVLSDKSIANCVSQLSHLDILVNNAGGGYNMPVSDLDIPEAKRLFDLNVWSGISVTQAFLPLLLESKGMIVNQTSVLSVIGIPFQSAYNASKAAMAMFSNIQRQELQPFGIKVVELKTGIVRSNFLKNQGTAVSTTLPENSIYAPARERIEEHLRGDAAEAIGADAGTWAADVVQDLMKAKPPPFIWRGSQAGFIRLTTLLPATMMDGQFKKISGIDVLEKKLA
jgi:1-acylglycerone phosphate reductase